MTDLLEERLRAAADHAMFGVELTDPVGDESSQVSRRHRWWLTAATGLVAATVLAVVVFAAVNASPGPIEPVQPAPPATPEQRARAAVAATLDAPAWSSVVSTPDSTFDLVYNAPDRFETVERIETADGPQQNRGIQIGDDLHVSEDGGDWTTTTIDRPPASATSPSGRRLPAGLSSLQGVLADGPCFAARDAFLVVWQDPETGCGSSTTALPTDLPPGSDVWVLRTDSEGRVEMAAVGEVPGVVGSERLQQNSPARLPSDHIESPLHEAEAETQLIYRFVYDGVPQVTAPNSEPGG